MVQDLLKHINCLMFPDIVVSSDFVVVVWLPMYGYAERAIVNGNVSICFLELRLDRLSCGWPLLANVFHLSCWLPELMHCLGGR
jgi:hypothetical protein